MGDGGAAVGDPDSNHVSRLHGHGSSLFMLTVLFCLLLTQQPWHLERKQVMSFFALKPYSGFPQYSASKSTMLSDIAGGREGSGQELREQGRERIHCSRLEVIQCRDLGVPLGGPRRVGGLLGVAGRLSGTVSPFRVKTSLTA